MKKKSEEIYILIRKLQNESDDENNTMPCFQQQAIYLSTVDVKLLSDMMQLKTNRRYVDV